MNEWKKGGWGVPVRCKFAGGSANWSEDTKMFQFERKIRALSRGFMNLLQLLFGAIQRGLHKKIERLNLLCFLSENCLKEKFWEIRMSAYLQRVRWFSRQTLCSLDRDFPQSLDYCCCRHHAAAAAAGSFPVLQVQRSYLQVLVIEWNETHCLHFSTRGLSMFSFIGHWI